MKNKINETMLKKYPKLVVLLILGSTLLCMSCASSENDSFINVSGPGDVDTDTGTGTGTGTDTGTDTSDPDSRCLSTEQLSGFNGGDGTEADPYLICNYVQLSKVRYDLDDHYKLGQDIDASASWSEGADACAAYDGSTVPSSNACKGWVSVGNHTNYFVGSFNGAGHAIQNLYQNRTGQYAGLFARTGSSAEVRNLGIENANISLASSHSSLASSLSFSYSAGLVAANAGEISNSYVTGSVSCLGNSYSYSAGLATTNAGEISNSYAMVSVSTSSDLYARSGGLVAHNSGTIRNSYARGSSSASSTTTGTAHTPFAISGGLVGYSNGEISNSYAAGSVSVSISSSTAYHRRGGLVGKVNSLLARISNSYWDRETSGLATSAGGGANNLSTIEMQAISGTYYPSALGSGFQLNAGEYPKVYKQDSTTDLVLGQ